MEENSLRILLNNPKTNCYLDLFHNTEIEAIYSNSINGINEKNPFELNSNSDWNYMLLAPNFSFINYFIFVKILKYLKFTLLYIVIKITYISCQILKLLLNIVDIFKQQKNVRLFQVKI